MMRTTVDLPEDVHRLAMSLARDRRVTFSATITDLVRRGIAAGAADTDSEAIRYVNGFPVVRTGRVTTSEDVRALEDE